MSRTQGLARLPRSWGSWRELKGTGASGSELGGTGASGSELAGLAQSWQGRALAACSLWPAWCCSGLSGLLWRCSVVLPWAALVLLCALGCSGAALGCSGTALGLLSLTHTLAE